MKLASSEMILEPTGPPRPPYAEPLPKPLIPSLLCASVSREEIVKSLVQGPKGNLSLPFGHLGDA